MVQLDDLLEGVPVAQDKAGARGEEGHWVPSPMLPPLGTKGRCNPSSPDDTKFRPRCHLHPSTHLHILETERRCSTATECTCKREADIHLHALTPNSSLQTRLQTSHSQCGFLSQNVSPAFLLSKCKKCLRVSHK